jgi:hypothetical protein
VGPIRTTGDRKLTTAAIGRCAAAAGGAVAAVLLAFPLGAYLVVALFAEIGLPLAKEMTRQGTEGLSGVHLVVVGGLVLLVALLFALYLAVALVAPIFVVLPLVVTAAALRLGGAGAITRTLWVMLAIAGVLAATIPATVSQLDLKAHRWTWLVIIAAAAFAGRLIVELWVPERADQPTSVSAAWRRWRRLVIAWLVLTMIAVAGAVVLVLTRVTML